jgi:septal ring-binding cell division protein DamX
MSEDKRFKNRVELSLDNRQIFLLFFASAAVIALVFALGVVVGKRSDTAPAKVSPTDPLALLDQMGAESGEETLTFHEALTKSEPKPAAPAGGAAPVPAPAQSPAAAPAPTDKPRATPTPTPAPTPIAKALAAALPGAKVTPAEPKPAAEKPAKDAAKPAKEPLAVKEKAKKPVKEGEAGEGGSYSLQLSAFQEKREAEAFMQKLREGGMQPFMTSTTIPGRGVWFRVRLGRYKTWDEALAAKQEFEKKAKLIAYVSKN